MKTLDPSIRRSHLTLASIYYFGQAFYVQATTVEGHSTEPHQPRNSQMMLRCSCACQVLLSIITSFVCIQALGGGWSPYLIFMKGPPSRNNLSLSAFSSEAMLWDERRPAKGNREMQSSVLVDKLLRGGVFHINASSASTNFKVAMLPCS